MDNDQPPVPAHPQGEVDSGSPEGDLVDRSRAVETFGGKVFVRWDADAAVTAFGPLTYFIEFLKANGLWQKWVEECPLHYTSPNAPPKADILGTILLSVLAGHKRYAHVTTIRSDSVLPGLLGMERVRSEDAVRRAFLKGAGEEYAGWLRTHLVTPRNSLLLFSQIRFWLEGNDRALARERSVKVRAGDAGIPVYPIAIPVVLCSVGRL